MSANKSSGKTKTILLFSGVRREDAGNKRLLAHQCPVTDCRLTGDMEEAASADAILFEGSIAEPTRLLHKARPPGQIWVLFFLESPFHTMGLKEYYGKVNYTATYRRDSTIVTPYERWVQHRNLSSLPSSPSKNYAEGKTKQVAWFVSNCGDKNGRLLYAKELQKYIGVDIYGQCGDKQCPRGEPRCTNMLRNDYKFYLAFENSNCQDYITEKLYWNAYQNDIIPIVMGARSEDYRKTAPPGSYIHVDSFASPRALADYLSLLDKDDSLYNQYFRWKNTGEFIDTKWWCRLCAMVHQPFIDHHQQTVTDLDSWWRGPGVCVAPKKGQRWATWRK
ncbi:hypothetical protein CAPTEDRAFT_178673 [Capitella teleta]|uniref:Fucosyltransferase n=1 Tax=Capitella teleta TaxID=283909 RepID=R7TLD1_CAPTE|nr:hypothetical protein CAPTEDRAFT_178673 [Capitella teleta]|eukprot:ELT94484.1 hypothetical protein CAPTEDRAFT_178673 [Capitella teleta]